jgi:alkyl hydroperoxide reductase subunit AhpC
MENEQCHSLMIGDTFPDAKLKTTTGDFSLYEYMGDKWLTFFSHPADFTPVCTTELGRVNKLMDDFTKRNCKVIALSGDSVSSHNEWIKDIEKYHGTTMSYPIIADEGLVLSKQIGMYHPKCESKQSIRTVYVLSPNKKVRLMIQYPPSTGRNFDEILRVIDSLQITDNYSCATPENWKSGDRLVILPTIKDEQAKIKFPQGFETITPYLRFVDLNKK